MEARAHSGFPSELRRSRELTVALAGNPNSGKTSLFNRLTGGHQHVGNYPGVTVEKKVGRVRGPDGPINLVDLPGTYGLNAFSDEERVARRYLLSEKPDLVVDVVDASNLERNLHLAVQLMELEVNLALAMNMSDMAQGQGQVLDLERLAELTGAPVVETVGHRGGGVDRLRAMMRKQAFAVSPPRQVDYGPSLEREIVALAAALEPCGEMDCPRRYAAVKLLENDEEIVAMIRGLHPDFAGLRRACDEAKVRLRQEFQDAPEILIADRRYGFAAGIAREVTLRRPRVDRITQSERADAILTHRLLGLPIFLAFMFGLFWLTFTVGDPLMGLIEGGFGRLADAIARFWPEGRFPTLLSLVNDGIIGGVGGVIVFLPNIVLLFMGISLLEDTGYMARAAFIMDRLMHRVGLHGKSFIPMLIGFGCTIPAIMATRTLPSKRDRIVTILILPFISCGARLPIYLLLIPAFFPKLWQAPVLWGLYLVGIGLGLLMAKVLSKTILGGEDSPFVMELPPYRLPTPRSVAIHMWQRASMYLRKAGTIILGISLVLWALMSFPGPPADSPGAAGPAGADAATAPGMTVAGADAEALLAASALEHSYAGRIGRAIQPVMAPLGFDWRITTGFLGAFAAKEVFVAQLGIIYALSGADEESEPLREALARNYSPAQGLAVLLFALLATPCMATVAVTRRESGRWAYALLQWFGLTATGYLLALLAYQLGTALGA